jgi:hypothetical protein
VRAQFDLRRRSKHLNGNASCLHGARVIAFADEDLEKFCDVRLDAKRYTGRQRPFS